MKHFTPAFFASLVLLIASTVEAGLIPPNSQLAQREPAFVDGDILDLRQLYDEDFFAFARGFDVSLDQGNFGRDFDALVDLEIRGTGGSKERKRDPERKAKYPTGNPKPETPKGEFRPLTAGKNDDYFGNWQLMTKGVNNPAAGKGKKKSK